MYQPVRESSHICNHHIPDRGKGHVETYQELNQKESHAIMMSIFLHQPSPSRKKRCFSYVGLLSVFKAARLAKNSEFLPCTGRLAKAADISIHKTSSKTKNVFCEFFWGKFLGYI